MKRETHRKALRAALGVVSGGRRGAGILTASAILGGAACAAEGGSPSGDEATGAPTADTQGEQGGDGGVRFVPPDGAAARADAGDRLDTEDAGDGEPGEVAVVDPETPQALDGTCLFPLDQECDGWLVTEQECASDQECDDVGWASDTSCQVGVCQVAQCDPEAPQLYCQDGQCYNGQMGAMDQEMAELIQDCCSEAYESEDFWVPLGCTPWGPPAPPAWDGRRLARPGLSA